MNPPPARIRRPATASIFAAVAGILTLGGGCASRTAPLRIEAIRLYDEGQYAAARVLLEQLDQKGAASGTLLYRLHYCQQASGDAAAQPTLERAVEQLEQELPTADGLDVPFYLVNAYQNLSRTGDARHVAEETTRRVESGELAQPQLPLEMFRLGKLYADQERSEPATRWYTSAIASFPEGSPAFEPYAQWASRYLAQPAFLRGDYPAAEHHYSRVAKAGQLTAADLDRLAIARYRIGHYADARTAWEQSAEIDQDDPDQARYCSRLAALAADIGPLPPAAPDGRPWSAMSKDDLQGFMFEQARRAQQTLAEAREPVPPTPERLAELLATIAEIQPLFVAAALEFGAQHYGIRETAFFGGFARLIFQKQEWQIGPQKPKQKQKKKQLGQ